MRLSRVIPLQANGRNHAKPKGEDTARQDGRSERVETPEMKQSAAHRRAEGLTETKDRRDHRGRPTGSVDPHSSGRK